MILQVADDRNFVHEEGNSVDNKTSMLDPSYSQQSYSLLFKTKDKQKVLLNTYMKVCMYMFIYIYIFAG